MNGFKEKNVVPKKTPASEQPFNFKNLIKNKEPKIRRKKKDKEKVKTEGIK